MLNLYIILNPMMTFIKFIVFNARCSYDFNKTELRTKKNQKSISSNQSEFNK